MVKGTPPLTEREGIEAFFAYARAREEIRLRRKGGHARRNWTADPILQQYRFCNVFREDDKTTAWFRESIREPLRDNPELVIKATAGFRWFTLIRTGEAIKKILLKYGWRSNMIRPALKGWTPPLVTGAYMMTSPPGYSKLDGICLAMDKLIRSGAIRDLARGNMSLEEAHTRLLQVEWLGDFRAYEIVTDLRHTCVLEKAPDILTWANPGPGALRGAGWVLAIKPNYTIAFRHQALVLMRELVRLANDPSTGMWPEEWPQWEAREAEHTLCEFDKWCRGSFTDGRLKRKFTPA